MRVQRGKTVVFYLGIGVLAFSLVTVAQRPKMDAGQPMVIFAVWPAGGGPEKNKGTDEPLLDPIAVFDVGKFSGLPGFDTKDQKASDAAFDQFEKKFYKRGAKYPLFIHGAKAGSAVVIEPVEVSCVSATATAKLPSPLPRGDLGLAVTSPVGLGVHPDRDATVSFPERASFRGAAAAYLVRKGLPRKAVSGVTISDVHSVFLGSRWSKFLVGTALLRRKDAVHSVFLVLTTHDGKPSPVIASYHRWTDVEDGTDSVYETFLSHLDFDNDGVDEIITTSYYCESWDYTIYKYQDGSWRAVYKSSGGGC